MAQALFDVLLHAAVATGLAVLARIVLKVRHTLLAFLGLGLFGSMLGGWVAALLNDPISLRLAGVHLVFGTLAIAALVFLSKLVPNVTIGGRGA